MIVGDKNEKPRIYLEGSTAKGLLPNILRYIEKQAPLSFNIELFPWARAYFAAKNGTAAIVGLSKTSDREAIFDFTVPIYFEDLLVVSLQKNPTDFTNIEDLYGKTVGIARGGVYGEAFEEAKAEGKLTVVEDNSPSQRLSLLLFNRVDIALIGSGIAGFNNALNNNVLTKGKKNLFFISETPLIHDPNYIGFHKSMKAQKTINLINAAIAKGYASGEIQNIIEAE